MTALSSKPLVVARSGKLAVFAVAFTGIRDIECELETVLTKKRLFPPNEACQDWSMIWEEPVKILETN